ncbi:MAG: glycine cleavage system protein H [Acidobacteria bacterium]|nr:glycine cleavage system protein H [Acidobacteriota bacterium]
MVAILVILTVVAFVAIDALRVWRKARSLRAAGTAFPVRAFAGVRVPRGLFLGNAHGWVRLTDSGELKVGLDEFLTQALGGADRVDLPEPGTRVRKGQKLATIWRLGHTLDVVAPVSGRIVATNDTVECRPDVLEADPYGSGWLARIWPADQAEELHGLRIGERAVDWLAGEIQRFADFLSRHTSPELVGATLPDGAHPVIGAALTLDEDAWKEFERDFAGVTER